MKKSTPLFALLNALVFIILFSSSPARAGCTLITQQSDDALKQQNMPLLRQLNRQAEQTASCSDQERQWLGHETAALLIRQARALVQQGHSDQAIPLLEEALLFDRHWMALAMLADNRVDRKEYGEASQMYQEALNNLNDPLFTPKPPNTVIIARIFKKAEQSRLLAENFVQTPASRSGEPGGLSMGNIRGFAVERVAVPVTFPYNSTEFTSMGKQAAAALLTDLQVRHPSSITLVGHTDPIGTREYNQDLSLRRAGKLRTYLKNNGFQGEIRVEGRGEDEPYQPVAGSILSEEELYRLCRRVEVEQAQ